MTTFGSVRKRRFDRLATRKGHLERASDLDSLPRGFAKGVSPSKKTGCLQSIGRGRRKKKYESYLVEFYLSLLQKSMVRYEKVVLYFTFQSGEVVAERSNSTFQT